MLCMCMSVVYVLQLNWVLGGKKTSSYKHECVYSNVGAKYVIETVKIIIENKYSSTHVGIKILKFSSEQCKLFLVSTITLNIKKSN